MMEYTIKGQIRFSIHDLKCATCAFEMLDTPVDTSKVSTMECPSCHGHNMHIRWDLSTRRPNVILDPNITPRDRAVVYTDPRTGKVAYPGQDTAFTRQKYESWGYERKEFTTVRELDKFCKENKVVNEKSNFNNGNGVN